MENHNSASPAGGVPSSSSDPKDPASFLSSIIGVPVTVKLNSGVVYKGELQSVDGYMNIALEKCSEYVDGKLRRKYGDAFVRGNNGTFLLFFYASTPRPCTRTEEEEGYWVLGREAIVAIKKYGELPVKGKEGEGRNGRGDVVEENYTDMAM
ncbi:U6 snRNA-associated Sm-like protein LSm6 [Cladophialophora bantiana CBS 173.52]|uniref:U6 snRNA-associated Sm-like protein LSm6 n=1 Tax=Cladophialophora bantiana (strain ATCC 10958 / CBS 173.52 / CDC B-1940 / NIH 8579) TaxID=1442370 RepID=A0A0D2ID94_CLAB1|nr:U6 snRNA-associated Sm-like protein LSm6 [Cladophialophora bantiana CBS 173.52]KIW94719.1 U6 snRNA-associated Sm-like protein LSm6 [Cladophialophora bantiana CBS 173.52]